MCGAHGQLRQRRQAQEEAAFAPPVQEQPLAAALPVQEQPLAAALPVQEQPLAAALPVQEQPLAAALPVQEQPALAAVLQQTQPQGCAQVTPAVLTFRQPQGQADAALAAFAAVWLHRGQLQRLQAIKIPPVGVGKGRGRRELPPITAYAGAAKVAIMGEREKSGPGRIGVWK